MNVQTRVKERAEEQSTAMTADQQSAIRTLANELHRLNHAVMRAVDAGVSVELVRSARHHGGEGNWGDLMIPVIVANPALSKLCSPEFAICRVARPRCPAKRSALFLTNPVARSTAARISPDFRKTMPPQSSSSPGRASKAAVAHSVNTRRRCFVSALA